MTLPLLLVIAEIKCVQKVLLNMKKPAIAKIVGFFDLFH